MNFENIIKSGSGLIDESEVHEAREAGFLIHHEEEYQDFDGQEFLTRDDWYAATPEFVARYYESGGTWDYS